MLECSWVSVGWSLVLWGSLDGGFFHGFRFDFLFIFESKLKGVGFIWGGRSGLLASLFGLRSIIFGLRGIILRGFWHHFSILGWSLGSLGRSLGSQGRPKSDFSDFLSNSPLIPLRLGPHFGVFFGVFLVVFLMRFRKPPCAPCS